MREKEQQVQRLRWGTVWLYMRNSREASVAEGVSMAGGGRRSREG